MSDKFYVGLDLTAFENNGVQNPISRVTLRVDGEHVLTAGDDSGFELAADCPHATQEMVNSILARVKGFRYQMYNASDINIDPAAELGDGITANGVYSVIARVDDDGSGFPSASAPGEAELEDEYPAGGPMTKAFDRKISETRSRITKTAEEIRLEVEKVNGDMVEMSASFSVQLQRITSRVQGAEGNISTLTQTANSLQSQIITANGNISTITQTVSSISSSVKNLEGEVSNIQQGANKISMSVTGGLGGTASIVLDVNGNKQMGNLDLSNVRQSFANDNSAVTISGGRVTFNSGTFVVNSNNLQVTETGTITATNSNFSGNITGSTITGSTFYSETTGQNGTSVSIQGGRMNLHYSSTNVGYIGTNRWLLDQSKRGIVFDLNLDGSFMAWGAQGFKNSDFFTKLIYVSDDGLYLNSVSLVDKFVRDRLYFECDGQFRKKAYLGGVPNNPDGYLLGDGHGMYVTACGGRFISLSVDKSEYLHIDESLVNIFATSSKTVHCYNNLDMHSNSVLNASDERLKTNIEPSAVDALDIIDAIQVYSFDWVEDGRHEDMGFIAQQLEAEASPNFISVSERDGQYSTRDLKLIPYLVKAVQQLSAMVRGLSGETAALRSVRRKRWTPTAYTIEEKEAYVESLRPDTTVKETAGPEPIILSA